MSIVKIENLSHRYSRSWAIQDINLDIERHGIYGLLGSNGAGKSTTLNILSGVLKATRGSVSINGHDMQQDPIGAKRQLGFLPQAVPVYLDLTVEEYLSLCAVLKRVERKDTKAAVDRVLARCGLTHMRQRLLKNLSGGYRQRAGIAQAIIHEPRLVILDEPTNGLDPVQIIEVRKLIKEIAEERTVILSSHILSEIQLMCRDIVMIEQGRLVFSDTIEAFNDYIAPQSLLIELEEAPGMEALGAIKGIDRVEQLTAKQYRLFYDGSRETGERMVLESVQRGWRLTQLAVEKNSVEEIFRQLSQGAEPRD